LSADRGRSAALGLAGRHLFEQRFDQPIAVAKWRALIAETAAEPAHN
jgi:hypothetical protein